MCLEECDKKKTKSFFCLIFLLIVYKYHDFQRFLVGLFLPEIAFELRVVCKTILSEVPCGFNCLQMSIDVQIDVAVNTSWFYSSKYTRKE